MSAIQGVFGALLGLLNFSLKYVLLASSFVYVALASYHAYHEGGSYIGDSLNILFLVRFLGLLLVPNSNPISPSLRLLGHTGAKVVAFVFWACGIALLLRDNYQDTVSVREVVTICMSACIFLILPVTHLEATGGDKRATRDTTFGTSETVAAVEPSDQGRGRSTYWPSYLQKVLAIWFILVCLGSFPWQGRIDTSADGILGEPMMVNNTIISNDIFLLPPELPTHTSLTVPWIPLSTPDFITTLGTPFQVTPTAATPSPVAKSTWVPAMSTTMPTPEPTPTALPEVEPDPEPMPQTAIELQDISGAFKLMVELLTAEAKSILPPQAKSALSWFLSLRVEDRCAAFALALVLAKALFTGLAALVSVISAPAILPVTCLPSTGLFFCLQLFGIPRGLSLIICVAFCVAFIVTLVSAAFLAGLLKTIKVLGRCAAEVPQVKANVSGLARGQQGLIGMVGRLSGEVAEFDKRLVVSMKTTREMTAATVQRVEGALAYLGLIIGHLGKRLTAVESCGMQLRAHINLFNVRLGQLESSTASSEIFEELKRAIENIEARLGDLKNTAEDDEARQRLKGELHELSARVDKLFESLGKRIDGLGSQLGNRIKEMKDSLSLLITRVDRLETDHANLRTEFDEEKAQRKADKKATDETLPEANLVQRMESVENLIRRLKNSKASSEVVKKLQKAIEEIKDQFHQLETTATDGEPLKKEHESRLDALSREVTELATSLGLRVGEVESKLQKAMGHFQGGIDRLSEGYNSLHGICTTTTQRVNEVVERVVKLENSVAWLKSQMQETAQAFFNSQVFSAMLDAATRAFFNSQLFSAMLKAELEKRNHDKCSCNTRSDPPDALHGTKDAPNGSRTGENSQDPDGTEPKRPRGRLNKDEAAAQERKQTRSTLQGLPICQNTGRVTDPHGHTVACVIPRPKLWGSLQSQLEKIGSVVQCEINTGEILGTKTKKPKPIADVRIPGDTAFNNWLEEYGDGEQGAADDAASTQSSGGQRSSSASRVPSTSSHTPDTSSPSSSPAGPSSDAPGSHSFCGPPGSPTSPGGPGLPSDPSGSPPSSEHHGSTFTPGGARSSSPSDAPGPSAGSQPSPGSPSGGPGPSPSPDGHTSPSPAGDSGVPVGMAGPSSNE